MINVMDMKRSLSFVFFILFTLLLQAQNKFEQNAVYLEVGGNAIVGSLNYEHQFSNKPGLGFRMGIGVSLDEELHPSIPLGVNYLIPLKNERSFVDVGLGTTFTYEDVYQYDYYGNMSPTSRTIVALVPSFGYRRHAKNSLMWRASVTPVISRSGIFPWVGFSIGKRF